MHASPLTQTLSMRSSWPSSSESSSLLWISVSQVHCPLLTYTAIMLLLFEAHCLYNVHSSLLLSNTDELLTNLTLSRLVSEVFSLKQHRLLHDVRRSLPIHTMATLYSLSSPPAGAGRQTCWTTTDNGHSCTGQCPVAAAPTSSKTLARMFLSIVCVCVCARSWGISGNLLYLSLGDLLHYLTVKCFSVPSLALSLCVCRMVWSTTLVRGGSMLGTESSGHVTQPLSFYTLPRHHGCPRTCWWRSP